MNREFLGVNGQLVTTWGRALEGTRWVGPERPVRWTCTCRCGKTVGGPGFSSFAAVIHKGWQLVEKELFCGKDCARRAYPEPERVGVRNASSSVWTPSRGAKHSKALVHFEVYPRVDLSGSPKQQEEARRKFQAKLEAALSRLVVDSE